MTHLEYWQEALSQALDDVGADGALTPEQIADVAASLAVAAENESMAMGHHSIPNPLNAEIERLKATRKDDEKRWEKREVYLERTIGERESRIRELLVDLARAKAAP